MGVGSVLQMYHLEMGASQAAVLYVLASWGFCKRISFGERWELRLSVGVRMGIYQLVIILVWESGSSRFSKIHDLTGHSGWLGYSTGPGSLLPSGPYVPFQSSCFLPCYKLTVALLGLSCRVAQCVVCRHDSWVGRLSAFLLWQLAYQHLVLRKLVFSLEQWLSR